MAIEKETDYVLAVCKNTKKLITDYEINLNVRNKEIYFGTNFIALLKN